MKKKKTKYNGDTALKQLFGQHVTVSTCVDPDGGCNIFFTHCCSAIKR